VLRNPGSRSGNDQQHVGQRDWRRPCRRSTRSCRISVTLNRPSYGQASRSHKLLAWPGRFKVSTHRFAPFSKSRSPRRRYRNPRQLESILSHEAQARFRTRQRLCGRLRCCAHSTECPTTREGHHRHDGRRSSGCHGKGDRHRRDRGPGARCGRSNQHQRAERHARSAPIIEAQADACL